MLAASAAAQGHIGVQAVHDYTGFGKGGGGRGPRGPRGKRGGGLQLPLVLANRPLAALGRGGSRSVNINLL